MTHPSPPTGARRRLTTLAAACLGLVACAQDVGLIDRTQPGGLPKAMFSGEWHYARTVVDAPYHVGYTFIGETEELERVRFEIREDQLIAYRSYDFVAGTDLAQASTAHPGSEVQGTPVAAWPIVRHFDVIRAYSVATGEQQNVLEENATDRPWFQRDFVRVDWSRNLLISFAFTVDGVASEPATGVITDPANPDALTLAERDDNGAWRDVRDPRQQRDLSHAGYFDFVAKISAKPIAWDYWDPDFGPERYPACWFYLNEDCKPAELSVRTAFLRVDPERDGDYLPLSYPDNAVVRDSEGKPIRVVEETAVEVDDLDEESTKSLGLVRDPDGYSVRVPYFDRFGYFRTERYGYDDKYGEVDAARQQKIQRFDLWQRSRDDSGKPIPYKDRQVRPIVYHLSAGFPESLRKAAQETADGWDRAFRRAIAARRGVDMAAVPRAFELRENTLQVDKDGVVTDRGQRIGDLRYSLLSNVDEPTRAGLLGYGPAWADPLTGRVIGGAAHVYGAQLRRFATTGRDLVRLVNGDLDPESYGYGEAAADEVVAALLGQAGAPGVPAGAAGKSGGAGKPVADKASGDKAGGDKPDSDKPGSGKPGSGKSSGAAGGGFKAHLPPETPAEARAFEARAFATAHVDLDRKKAIHKLRKEKLAHGADWARQRLERIAGSPLEAALHSKEAALGFGPPSAQAAAADAGDGAAMPAFNPAVRERISPRRWAGLANRLAAADRERLLLGRNLTHAAFVDDQVLGIAKEVKDLDPEAAWQKIYVGVFRATAEHEIGHTVGLRHNFEASTDALNWHPDYWKLRGAGGKPFDKPTPEQLAAGMNDLRYSSIMEYAGRFHADLHGLGRYDEAAIAFGYTELVEVFGDKAVAGLHAHGPTRAAVEEIRFRAGGDPSLGAPDAALDATLRGLLHYTAIPSAVGGVANIDDRRLVPLEDLVAEMSGAGSTDKAPRPRALWPVPYRFCSDEYEMGTATCNVYDDGADPSEIIGSGIARWRDHYVIDAFRRDRVDFFLDEYAGRVWFRFMHPVVRQYQHWLFDQYDPDDFYNPGVLWDWISSWRPKRAGIAANEAVWEQAAQGGLTATEAVRRGIGWLSGVIGTPEPGAYCLDKAKNRYTYLGKSTGAEVCAKPQGCDANGDCVDLLVPLGVGRYQESEYEFETGYTFYERLRFAGAFYDKVTALEVLADPSTSFIGVDASQSINSYILSTFLVFPKEITQIFGGIAAGSEAAIGWRVGEGGALQPLDVFAPTPDPKLPLLEVPGLYVTRPFAIYYGMAWLSAAWDSTFNDAIKVWIDGSGEALTLPAEATVATFTNPLNHRTYSSMKVPRDGWFSPGFEMVQAGIAAAAAYKADPKDVSARWDLEDATSFLELTRGMFTIYGLTLW